jgi:hypothetical protein
MSPTLPPRNAQIMHMQLYHWRHKEQGKEYRVIGECLVKDAETGVWELLVMYLPVHVLAPDQVPYARTPRNFLERFERLPKP